MQVLWEKGILGAPYHRFPSDFSLIGLWLRVSGETCRLDWLFFSGEKQVKMIVGKNPIFESDHSGPFIWTEQNWWRWKLKIFSPVQKSVVNVLYGERYCTPYTVHYSIWVTWYKIKRTALHDDLDGRPSRLSYRCSPGLNDHITRWLGGQYLSMPIIIHTMTTASSCEEYLVRVTRDPSWISREACKASHWRRKDR